jgi:hypothetical protein
MERSPWIEKKNHLPLRETACSGENSWQIQATKSNKV